MLERVIQAIDYRSYLEKKYKAEFESRWANVEGKPYRARGRAWRMRLTNAVKGPGERA